MTKNDFVLPPTYTEEDVARRSHTGHALKPLLNGHAATVRNGNGSNGIRRERPKRIA
jgi:hypothetical protein